MKIAVLNWKMNPNSLESARSLFKDTLGTAKNAKNVFTIICPSFVHIVDSAHLLEIDGSAINVALGSQNISFLPEGSLTGEVSASMLKDSRVDYCLIGHSERRFRVREDSSNIKDRILNAIAFGITPILFVGESERSDAWQDEIIDELNISLEGISQDQISKIIFAYEPVWAISGGGKLVDFDMQHAKEAVIFLRNIVAKLAGIIEPSEITILYGGSVNASMMDELSKIEEYSGFVVGKSSLDVDALQSIYSKLA